MAKELIDTLYGKYGVYKIYRDSGMFGTSYTIEKDGKYWKNASNPSNAVDLIKKHDPQAETK